MQGDLFRAQANRDKGIAVSSGNAGNPWNREAYALLNEYLDTHDGEFLLEDIRVWAESRGFRKPPSKRAWGAVVVKASKAKLIKHIGYKKTTNPLAHRTPAALWAKREVFHG